MVVDWVFYLKSIQKKERKKDQLPNETTSQTQSRISNQSQPTDEVLIRKKNQNLNFCFYRCHPKNIYST
jgi:hypothetical protein